MQGTIDINPTTMPPVNIALIIGGVAFLMVLAAIIVHRLGITSLGPIKRERKSLSTEYYMNDGTRKVDDSCQKQMRQITDKMILYISNIFAELKVCALARVAISSAIRQPMYESVANNHFTTELTVYYDAYRDRIINMMREEYVSLATASKDIQCNRDALPPWEQVGGKLIHCIDLWLGRICREVVKTCEKKIEIYKQHLKEFRETKDEYRSGFTRETIEKNERYIAVLKTRIGKEVA